ncbi:hypothetical protein MXB_162 [Myxobolus squamalis]|nr:hypothetical protein MXB_162 [Myxobolus squamalis]
MSYSVGFSNFNLSGRKLFTVSENTIKQVEDSFQSIEVNLSNNYFHEVPLEIKCLPFSEYLNFSNNLLTSCHHICNLKFLIVLDLSHNYLSEIDAVFQLKNLQILIASFNKLKKIPSNIIDLQNLQQCNFECNKINYIHDNLFKLKFLKIINLKKNSLEYIPKAICNLKSLESLDLSSNHISTIEITICMLNSLRILIIDENPITFPPSEVSSLGLNAIKGFFTSLLGSDELTKNQSPIQFRSSDKFLNNFNAAPNSLMDDSSITSSKINNICSYKTESRVVDSMRQIIQTRLNLKIPVHIDFFNYISDGVCLCKLIKKYKKNNHITIFVPTDKTSSLNFKQKSYNIIQFLDYCRKIIPESQKLCIPDDILSGKYNEDSIRTISSFLQINGETISENI